MLDLHYDRLVSDGISGWDLWLLANGWGDAVAAASLQPQHESRRTLNGNEATGRQWRLGNRSEIMRSSQRLKVTAKKRKKLV